MYDAGEQSLFGMLVLNLVYIYIYKYMYRFDKLVTDTAS